MLIKVKKSDLFCEPAVSAAEAELRASWEAEATARRAVEGAERAVAREKQRAVEARAARAESLIEENQQMRQAGGELLEENDLLWRRCEVLERRCEVLEKLRDHYRSRVDAMKVMAIAKERCDWGECDCECDCE